MDVFLEASKAILQKSLYNFYFLNGIYFSCSGLNNLNTLNQDRLVSHLLIQSFSANNRTFRS